MKGFEHQRNRDRYDGSRNTKYKESLTQWGPDTVQTGPDTLQTGPDTVPMDRGSISIDRRFETQYRGSTAARRALQPRRLTPRFNTGDSNHVAEGIQNVQKSPLFVGAFPKLGFADTVPQTINTNHEADSFAPEKATMGTSRPHVRQVTLPPEKKYTHGGERNASGGAEEESFSLKGEPVTEEQITEKQVHYKFPEIALKALSLQYAHVRVLENGDIELRRTETGNVFNVSPSDALKLIAMNAEVRQTKVKASEQALGQIEERLSVNRTILQEPPVLTDIVEEGFLQKTSPQSRERDNGESSFDYRFATEFDIGREDLESIAGFEKLTMPQQKLLFENFQQSTYGRVKEEALKKNEVLSNEKRRKAVEKYGKRFGNAWAGVHAAFAKEYRTLSHEQELLATYHEEGFTANKELLTQLVESMVKFGPRVHEGENGELDVDFVNMREWGKGENRKAEKLAAQKLNTVAHHFAKMPPSWKEDTLGVDSNRDREWKITSLLKGKLSASRKMHLAYEKVEKEFIDARNEFARTLTEAGTSEAEVAQMLVAIDTRVQQQQFLTTSPEVVKEIAAIEHKNVWYETAKSIVSKSGLGYVALGYVGRTMLVGTTGWFAAPVVSSGIAGSRSWNRSAAELRERDRSARLGATDTSKEALNIVSAGGRNGLIEKANTLIGTYHVLNRQIAFGEMNGENTDHLLKKRDQILGSLQVRAEYITDKQKLNRVNYGTRNEFIGNQTRLYEALGEASCIIAEHTIRSNDSLASRLNRYLAYKETAIDARRRTYRKQEVYKQAIKAGGFSLAGAFLADVFYGGPTPVSSNESLGGGQSEPVIAPVPHTGEIVSGNIDIPAETVHTVPNSLGDEVVSPHETLSSDIEAKMQTSPQINQVRGYSSEGLDTEATSGVRETISPYESPQEPNWDALRAIEDSTVQPDTITTPDGDGGADMLTHLSNEKVDALQSQFIKSALHPAYWDSIKNMTVGDFEHMVTQSQDSGYNLGTNAQRLQKILKFAQGESLNLTSKPTESVETYMNTVFKALSEHSVNNPTNSAYQDLIKKISQ